MLRRFPIPAIPAMLPGLIAACLAALALAAAAPPDEGDDLIAEFRRFYTSDRSQAERLQGVLVLDGLDRLAAAQALLPALEDEDLAIRKATIEVLAKHTQAETAAWLLDGVLLDRKNTKRKLLRAGVASVLGGMKRPEAYVPLLAMLEEKDPVLRLAAIDALGRMGNPQACPTLAALAADPDGTTAMAAVDALILLGPSDITGTAVLGALEHSDWRVRARAIGGSVTLRLKDSVPLLIKRMQLEEGRLVGDAYQALRTLTLRNFDDDPQQWVDWWERIKGQFELPDLKKLAEEEARLAKLGIRYSKVATKKTKTFLGVETKSESMVFVIDVSGSMETPFGDPERLKSTGRTYASLQRLEIVKEELIATINDLPETTSFNILTFASKVDEWKKDLVKANVLNKNNACAFVRSLKPVGGASAGFKAQTGLSTKMVEEGGTNVHMALLTALGVPEDVTDVDDIATKLPKTPLDTIFFLGDGEPTVGRSVDMTVIRSEVRRVNQYRGVAIHVIYVGEFGGDDFEELARENRGIFVAIGG